MLKYLALLIPLAALAADPAGFVVWKSAELKGMEKKLAPKVDAQKVATQSLANFGNHSAMVAYRQGSGQVELHVQVADVFVVESGEGTVVVGGKIIGGKTTAPGEVRGASIEGGSKHPVAAGDIVHIPADTPHQMLVDSGKQITYFVVKVNAK
jgi:mannose-6-phosphate isomerase-like protein (cupin superfamily)